LEEQLAVLHREGVIAAWDDTKIVASTPWKQAVETNIESADIVLLLVSPAFLASKYCYEEMSRAFERQKAGEARVIPIILRPSDWKPEGSQLGEIQALPKNGRPISKWTHRDDAFLDVSEGLRAAIAALAPRGARKTLTQTPPTKSLRITSPPREIWDVILGDQPYIPVVVSNARVIEFIDVQDPSRRTVLPRNTPILGLHEAVGITELTKRLASLYPERGLELRNAQTYEMSDWSFISVGGPEVNQVTAELLRPNRLAAGITLVRADLGSYGMDEKTGDRYQPEIQGDQLLSDFGFIIIGPNPSWPERFACTLFGVWPPGSAAAIRTLVKLETGNPLAQELLGLLADKRGAVAVVETRLRGLKDDAPTLIRVRALRDA
jgi:hypothetical protein